MPIALITGPGSGIGRATAVGLGRSGWHVIGAGRSRARVEPVIGSIRQLGGSAEYLELDLASFESVRAAARIYLDSGRHLDVLVNNAGIGVKRRRLTDDGFEPHFGINHLGHFLLTRELGPAFAPGARVVSLASAMHFRAGGIDFARVRRPPRLTGLAEYASSKLANILFTKELARRQNGLQSFAVHPGLVATSIIPAPLRALARNRMRTPEQGADTVLWCATSPEVADSSGSYYQDRSEAIPSAVAQDAGLARELWERSERWCG